MAGSQSYLDFIDYRSSKFELCPEHPQRERENYSYQFRTWRTLIHKANLDARRIKALQEHIAKFPVHELPCGLLDHVENLHVSRVLVAAGACTHTTRSNIMNHLLGITTCDAGISRLCEWMTTTATKSAKDVELSNELINGLARIRWNSEMLQTRLVVLFVLQFSDLHCLFPELLDLIWCYCAPKGIK